MTQFAAMGQGASVYETSLYLADCLTRAGRPADALDMLAEAVDATNDDVSIFDAARARFTAAALIALGRFDEAAASSPRASSVARARGLEYELGLLLAVTRALPFAVPTGSDEPPLVESARLFTRLGVVARPETVGIGRVALTVTATSGRRRRGRAGPGRSWPSPCSRALRFDEAPRSTPAGRGCG